MQTLLPLLFVGGLLTLFVGSAVVFGVWLPQWLGNRRSATPEPEPSIDAAATTGRFHRSELG